MHGESIERLKERFGSFFTAERGECILYERDMGWLPEMLVKPLAQTAPLGVVRPQSAADVSDAFRMAREAKLAVTPRAGASTVYFNAVCAQGGLVLDLNGLQGVGKVDAATNVVEVAAGVTWSRLERELAQQGYAACSYPSSAPGATVGGWFAMKGYGLGSLQAGPLKELVEAAEVVLPDGSVKTLRQEGDIPVQWLAESEGTLGVVTQLSLKVRRLEDAAWHGVFAFAEAWKMQGFIETLLKEESLPFNLHFSDPACNHQRFLAGLGSERAGKYYTVAVDALGTETQVLRLKEAVEKEAYLHSGENWSEEGEEEWNHRFFSLLLKRRFPGMLGAELWLPMRKATAYLEDTARCGQRFGREMMTYGHVVSRSHALVMTAFPAESQPLWPLLCGLGIVAQVQDAGWSHGGVPYGVGLWNTSYLSRLYQAEELTELRRRKAFLDPEGRCNPGKLYQAPLQLKPPLFSLAMSALALGAAMTSKGGSR